MCSHPQQHPQTGVSFHVPPGYMHIYIAKHICWGARTRCCSLHVTADVLSHQPIQTTTTAQARRNAQSLRKSFSLSKHISRRHVCLCVSHSYIHTRARWPSTNTLFPSLYRSLFIGSIARAPLLWGVFEMGI